MNAPEEICYENSKSFEHHNAQAAQEFLTIVKSAGHRVELRVRSWDIEVRWTNTKVQQTDFLPEEIRLKLHTLLDDWLASYKFLEKIR